MSGWSLVCESDTPLTLAPCEDCSWLAMSKPREIKRQTRVLSIDGELSLILAKRKDVLVAMRLTGEKREFAEKLLDDVQFEIEAHVVGYEGP